MSAKKRNQQPEGEITTREAGRRGGRATLEQHGIEFFAKIGKKGGQRTKELYKKKPGRPKRPSLDEPVEEGK